MLVRYVAAVLDQDGQAGVRALRRTPRPGRLVEDAVFAEAGRRGFAGCFPQLLSGVRYWLPFERDTVIKETSWTGEAVCLGSAPRLLEEITLVQAAIVEADPGVPAWDREQGTPQDDTLAAAWQAGDIIARLCTLAVERHLPLWTTG